VLFNVKVFVSIKEGVLDPQGKTVNEALHHLGYPNISDTRIGKYITFSITSEDKQSAEVTVKEACKRVLTNPIIETFDFTLKEAEEGE